jgi:hypothetical protein
LGKLVAAVRAEFRHDVLVFDATDPVFGGRLCKVDGCARTSRSRQMCDAHHQQWLRGGRPELAGFLKATQPRTGDHPAAYESRLELHRLGRQLKLEVQYALQHRRDDKQVKTRPGTARRVVNVLADSGATSLLDLSGHEWTARFPGRCAAEVLLRYARQQVEDLWRGTGWEAEYPRDLWRLRDLGASGQQGRIRFDRIP